MNEVHLVSIIVPVYKVEKYLDLCIESIVNQTYSKLEIILVDDGSPDNCPAMCDEWAKKDGRIKVIHKENDGLSNARNSGIEECSGDFVMFVDSDDYIDSDMVEFLLNLSVEYDADVSRCGFYYDYESGSQIEASASDDYSVKLFDYEERMIDLTTGGHISGVAWNKLYKYDVIKSHPYDKNDGCSEDIMHNYRVYRDVKKTVFCNIPKYHYLIRENSILRKEFGLGAFDIIRAKQIIIDGEKNNKKVLPYAVKGYITSAFIVLSGCITNDAFPEKQKELIKSILSYKKEIFSSSLYSKLDKFKTFLLSISPKLYYCLIKNK